MLLVCGDVHVAVCIDILVSALSVCRTSAPDHRKAVEALAESNGLSMGRTAGKYCYVRTDIPRTLTTHLAYIISRKGDLQQMVSAAANGTVHLGCRSTSMPLHCF